MKRTEIIKITKKNIKSNREDYLLYFITLTLAVSLFYILNTIMGWNVLTSGDRDFIVSIGSGFVILLAAMIMAFLFLYANRFLLKRRSRELSIYMLLGMKNSEIQNLLSMELKYIGAASFVNAILLSSMIMWAIMTGLQKKTGIQNIGTICSLKAFLKTVIYFIALLWFIIQQNKNMLENSSILELENSSKRNEEGIGSPRSRKALVFIASIGLLGIASRIGWILSDSLDWRLVTICAIAGIIGTFLFFATLFEAVTKVCSSIKIIYLRRYHSFLINQLRRNFHANHIAMSIVSLCLVLSIGCFFCSYYFVTAFQQSKRQQSCYDITVQLNSSDKKQADRIDAKLAEMIEETGEHEVFETATLNQDEIRFAGKRQLILCDTILPLSSYNEQMRLIGEEEISLSKNEYAICSGFIQDSQNKELLGETLSIGNTTIVNGSSRLLKSNVFNSDAASNLLVLSDDTYQDIIKNNTVARKKYGINIIFKTEEKKQMLQEYLSQLKEASDITVFEKEYAGEYVKMDATHFYIMLLCGYMGMIFLCAACTILTMYQISEVFESRKRYHILLMIGGKKQEIRRLLAKQIGIIFAMPYLLAALFSFIILKGLFHDTYVENIRGVIGSISLSFTVFYFVYYGATVRRGKKLLL